MAAQTPQQPFKIPPELQSTVHDLLGYINNAPSLQSLLYDLNWLPEQLEEGSKDWFQMLILTQAWKHQIPSTPEIQPPSIVIISK